jgi:hypothetical protein
MTTDNTDSERVNQQSPLLNLPAEIRLLIYAFALQHMVEDMKATTRQAVVFSVNTNTKPKRAAMKGALALLHTSSLLRSESSDTLRPLARLERFHCRPHLSWNELGSVIDKTIYISDWSDVLDRLPLMRNTQSTIERAYRTVHGVKDWEGNGDEH